MRTSTFRTSTRPSPARRAPCLLFISLALLLAACVSGPNLRALNPDEAKIDVYADGTVHVLGEPIAMGDLSGIVEHSSTEAADTILIRLHGDPDSPEFVELRKYVTDQMIRAGHYKFRFFSTPQASITTYDPRTGKAETSVSGLPVRQLSGREIEAEAQRMSALRSRQPQALPNLPRPPRRTRHRPPSRRPQNRPWRRQGRPRQADR